MKKGLKRRILSLVLCISMFSQVISVHSIGVAQAHNTADNYGAAIGAIAEWDVASALLASNRYESNDDVKNGVSTSSLPAKLVITNYAYDDVNAQLWYKVDAAPGYTWPEEYANYHWIYDYSVRITNMNGMTGVFDDDGSAVTKLKMGVYGRPVLTAASSLQGAVEYQWQICYDAENDLWVDIYGQDEAKLTVTIGIFATVFSEDGAALLRCVSKSASKSAISDIITVTVDFNDLSGGSGDGSSEPTLDILLDGSSVSSVTTTYGNYNFEKTLTSSTNLCGTLTYKWEMLTDSTNDLWSTLSTESSVTLSYTALTFKYHDSNSDIAKIRLTVSNGETDLTDTFIVYRIAEAYITVSSGDTTGTVDVTVSGSLPDDAILNLNPSEDSVPGVATSEVSLTLDVTISKYGEVWQPAEGETVRVSIPASQLGLTDGQYFAVYHIHDGETELLGPYMVENGYVTFDIDGFSTIVISTNYGAAIGGTAEFHDSSFILDTEPASLNGQTIYTADFPVKKVAITNYYFDEVNFQLWYKIDAAPGYTWPEEYANYHWVYAYALTNTNFSGEMGIYDEEGNPVSRVEIPVSSKPVYSAVTTLQGDVEYQWQLCYDVANYLWMNIEGQTEESITLSYALLAGMLDEGNMCAVRCVISNAAKTQYGYPLVIRVTDDSTIEPDEPTVDNYADITVNGEVTDSAELADRYDVYDETVGDYVEVEGGSLNLSVNSNLTGDGITYTWQALSGTEWITISTDKDYVLTFSDLMFAQAYSGSTAYVRVIVNQDDVEVVSDYLTISIVEAAIPTMSAYMLLRAATPMMYATSNVGIATAAETDNTVLVTVQFVMGNDTVPIENGLFTYQVPYNGAVTDIITIPAVTGYAAYLEDDRTTVCSGTYDLNLSGVTEAKTITFRFWPAEVEYKVEYLQQNIFDDEYTIVRTDELTGLTGSDPIIENVIYEGFAQVWCDVDKIAADSSTVIQVRYDRLYFKMLFDLDGGYGVQPVYARYDTPITVINPTKAGYTFMGWDSDGDGDVDIEKFENIAIPAEHTDYTAIWQASDSAKVTVVIWGQNPNDNSYSYLADESANLSFDAKPGSTVTYDPTAGDYICGYTNEHTHGVGCEATCGKTGHTHSEVVGSCYTKICGKDEHTSHTESCYACGIEAGHTHSTGCYDGATTTKRSPATGMPDNYSEGYVHDHWYYDKLIYIDGSWYEYDGSITNGNIASTNCGKTEGHTHTDACIGENSSCPGIHNHTDACYKLTCTEHEHTAACYEGCTKEEHTHGAACTLTVDIKSNLWTYSHSDTVIVAADGSTVMNVYYDRTTFTITFKATGNNGATLGTITDKWGADIRQRFEDMCKAHTFLWSENSDGNDPWTSFLDVMPEENRTYYARTTSSTNVQTAKYWGADLNGEYTVLLYTSAVKYGNNLTVSKEEFIDIEGYEFAYGIDGDGDRMSTPGSYGDFDGANFYYNRASYNLVFDNYGTTFKNESVLYEASLSGYVADSYKVPDTQAPAVYQEGSVVFKGWYLAPQTPYDFDFSKVEPFDFANSTMPASDLKLYAWWEPVTHNVTFYYDLAALEAGTIYTADGFTYEYEVPHGSEIQDPHTPPKDPTSNYYSFVGWFYVDANGQESMWDFTNTTVTDDVRLYGKWTSNTPAKYEVRFVTIKDGVKIDIAEPEIGMALGGDNKKFDAKFGEDLYEGYQTRYYPTTMSHSITIDLVNTEKNYYEFIYEYVEYTSYTVKYLEAGTDTVLATQKNVSNNTYAMVTEQFVPIAGYLPDAYQKVCYINPDGTNEIIFYYTQDTENGLWVVHYWLEDANGNFVENVDLQFTGTAKNGAVVTSPTDTVIPNYTYDADNSKNVSSGTVSVDLITHLQMYYVRDLAGYKVQYMEYGTDKVLATEKIGADTRWGTLITETAIDIPNYTIQENSEYTIEISVDEEDNVITFYYVEKTITINYVPLDGGSVDRATETVKVVTGEVQGSAAAPAEGYKFVGWYLDEDCTQQVSKDATYVPGRTSATYYAKFEYDLTSLTITKAGWNEVDTNQTFIFNISGNGVDLDVTVHGNGSVTIDGLTVGKTYTITEKTNWSWRYESEGWTHGSNRGIGNIATITIGLNGEITFTNKRPNDQWLDGDSYKVNIFKKKED